MMYLYQLRRGDNFTLLNTPSTSKNAPDGYLGEVYEFSHMDGLYGTVFDSVGHIHYFKAGTEVESVEID